MTSNKEMGSYHEPRALTTTSQKCIIHGNGPGLLFEPSDDELAFINHQKTCNITSFEFRKTCGLFWKHLEMFHEMCHRSPIRFLCIIPYVVTANLLKARVSIYPIFTLFCDSHTVQDHPDKCFGENPKDGKRHPNALVKRRPEAGQGLIDLLYRNLHTFRWIIQIFGFFHCRKP